MKRTKVLGIALMAVFAMSAVATSAALAAPEFVHCVAKAGGTFGAGCTTVGSGFAKEAVPAGSKIKFTDKEGTSKFNAKGEITFTCTADTSKGEITGPTTVAGIGVIFTGCTAKEGSGASCAANSTGSAAGTIATNALKGVLGNASVTKAGATVPGESLVPEVAGKSFTKLEANCLGTKTAEVTNGVVGEALPVGTMSNKGELIFACTAGKPTVQKLGFIGGVETTLKAFAGEACFESKDEVLFSENIEVT
jgi:hypothetical protein